MSGELEAKLFSHFFLQALDFFILKFHDLAAVQANKMVMMVIRAMDFKDRTSVPK